MIKQPKLTKTTKEKLQINILKKKNPFLQMML
jgi:hypothetical protein